MTRFAIFAAAAAAVLALAAGGATYAMRGSGEPAMPRTALEGTAGAPEDTATATIEPELTCEQAGACAMAATAIAEPGCVSLEGSPKPCDDIKPCRGEGPCAMPIAPCEPQPGPTPAIDIVGPPIRCLPIAPCEIQPMAAPAGAPVEPPFPCPPLPCEPLPMATPGVMPPLPGFGCYERALPPGCAISSGGTITCPGAPEPCAVPPAPGAPDTMPCVELALPPNCVLWADGAIGCTAEPCGASNPDGSELLPAPCAQTPIPCVTAWTGTTDAQPACQNQPLP